MLLQLFLCSNIAYYPTMAIKIHKQDSKEKQTQAARQFHLIVLLGALCFAGAIYWQQSRYSTEYLEAYCQSKPQLSAALMANDPAPTIPPNIAEAAKMTILKEGDGATAYCGGHSYVFYRIFDLQGNTILSTPEDVPERIRLGSYNMIAGVEQQIVGMKEGEIRQILLEEEDIEGQWREQLKNLTFPIAADIQLETVIAPQKTPYIAIVKPGRGIKAKCGRGITISLRKQIEATEFQARPEFMTLTLGSNNVPLWITNAITGMRYQEIRLAIPPKGEEENQAVEITLLQVAN